MICFLFWEKEKKKEKRNDQGAFPKAGHALLAGLCGIFLSCYVQLKAYLRVSL
jgi:hypothetical protein